jgi:transposase-like protein
MAVKAPTAVIREAYIQGISTRSVDDLVKARSMSGISESQVSRLYKEIDQRAKAFLDQPTEGDSPLSVDRHDLREGLPGGAHRLGRRHCLGRD